MQNLSLKSPFTITTIEAIEKYDLRQLHKEVNKFAFPKHGVPTADTILTGFKDIISDTMFNAAGSITARKISQKVRAKFN